MIAHLAGTLLSKQATSAIIDVGGVGYEVAIPLSTFYELGEAGSPVQLRVYTHVREDALQLYGFKTARERELFLQCVHRAALVCSEKSNSVKVKLSSNLLEITAQSPDFGEAHESMAIAYSGPELQVAFNPQFVMDPLRALAKDEVFFEVKDEVSPGVFKTLDSFICVIMPVRLS